MFTFRHAETTDAALQSYVELFSACFPKAHHLNIDYLRWLYAANPAGKVIGVDAMDGDTLAAHYVCVPADIWLFGVRKRGMLSLNTATHPNYQGKGLFTQLAEKTYLYGSELGIEAVFGVANANSTPGFIRKLGFTLVSPLDARIGVGRPRSLDWSKIHDKSAFRRDWNEKTLIWRMNSPANRIYSTSADKTNISLYAKTDRPGIVVWGETDARLQDSVLRKSRGTPSPLRLFLGLHPPGTYKNRLSGPIPGKLRPAPLNFIYRNLAGNATLPDANQISFDFFDFDAY